MGTGETARGVAHVLWASTFLVCSAGGNATATDSVSRGADLQAPGAIAHYLDLPLRFEVNRGQAHEDVRFVAHGRGHSVYLTANGAVIALAAPVGITAAKLPGPAVLKARKTSIGVRMTLVGATTHPRIDGIDPLETRVNYLVGNDPVLWRTDIPNFARVRYSEVYPGIDVVYYGNQRRLEHDFIIQPGADPARIRMRFTGADRAHIDAQGDLVLDTSAGEIRQRKPFIYQEIDGRRNQIDGRYALLNRHTVAFRLAAYDRARPLIIDPVLSYSTYLGGGTGDRGNGVAVDAGGNVYVAGSTASTDFPGASPGAGGANAFVAKLNPSGTALVYATYIGGSGEDAATAIAVNGGGDAFITGRTRSPDLPTTPGALQPALAGPVGGSDAFVARLDATGSALVYATYLGGADSDEFGAAIAVDAAGNAYVAGTTSSRDFPTTAGAVQPTFPGSDRFGAFTGFIAKLDPGGAALAYSTFLGGSSERGGDDVNAIAIDAAGSAFVTGLTASPDFPTTPGALQRVIGAGGASFPMDAFVTRLDAAGALLYSTFLGGSDDDAGRGIAVDGAGNAYVTGSTGSLNFPTTAGAYQQSGAGTAFVTKLDAAGAALVYSTYLGGRSGAQGNAIVLDGAANAYVTGTAFQNCGPSGCSADFPVTGDAFQSAYGGAATDAFVARLNAAGSSLIFASYLGGSGADGGAGIAIDPSGSVFVVGTTNSGNFPATPGALQRLPGGSEDAFIVRIDDNGASLPLGELSLSDTVLWPPNHQLIGVTHSIRFSAAAVGTISVSGPVVTSNEPENGLGDGDQAPDWVVDGNALKLRAERDGRGSGRIYTVTYELRDEGGNHSQVRATVRVPLKPDAR